MLVQDKKCVRCKRYYLNKVNIMPIRFFLSAAKQNFIEIDVYECEECGKIEFFRRKEDD